MGRRRQFMDDGDDSSDDEGGRIHFDITDRDLEEEAEGFYGQRKTKGKKRFADDMGDDDDDDGDDERGGLGRGGIGSGLGLPKMVNFQMAQQSPQPGSGSNASSKASTPEPSKRRRPAAADSTKVRPSEGFAEFTQHSKGVAKRMLEKMGWRPGQGLGKEGSGIVNPIETKLRPKGMGMGFRGFTEMTAQAREEAKLRGDVVSSEEEEEEDADGNKPAKPQQKREAWKRTTKPKKPKQIYKTAAAIIDEHAGTPEAAAATTTTQKVIDMRGPTVREISIQDLQRHSPSWQETTNRLPELRHNLRLLVDLARGDLENLARDRQTNKLRIKAIEEEVGVIESKRKMDTLRRDKLLEVKEMAAELDKLSRDARATGAYEQANITAIFGSVFEKMLKRYTKDDIRTFHLDQIVVAVWAPIMKYKTMRWDVLEDPTWGAKDVLAWRELLVANDDDDVTNDADFVIPRRQHRKETPNATPFEMMMNTVWLVRVRSAINNTWNVREPEPMIALLETWKPVLPRFIFENIINQLVLPKISRAVSDWDPRNDPEMIHTWIHPWLPVLEYWRLGELFTTIRHKISVILRAWHPSDESALHIITPWKDIWTRAQMEGFLLKSILPKLKHVLRNEFFVNPRDQKLEPLIWVMAWQNLFSDTVMAQLLENEFFTKWLDVLYKWLTLSRDRVNYDEVREWYLWWRQIFETYGLDSNATVSGCFRKGLDMMAAAANGEPVTRS
ncbi:GC-rich sequence DNA-binding factor-like protein-domain-containing protein [Dichotomocladium elegans]|nr:GC-rich sequence DNA-binding factor-like protein-domain-containing protein [Dichotomocladium elegans]